MATLSKASVWVRSKDLPIRRLLHLAFCDTLARMAADRLQCPFCGFLLAPGADVCPVCHPDSEVPDHVKAQWATAHLRGVILYLGADGGAIREACLWEEHAFPQDDVRHLLLAMEEDGEIVRFAGHYRTRGSPNAFV
jgi:hypothetical protein